MPPFFMPNVVRRDRTTSQIVDSMEFATTDLRERLLRELRHASSADIAVAFFNPEQEVFTALAQVPKIRLLVANDFQVNNPDRLEALSQQGHWVRAVSAEASGGNLHSKVYLIQRNDKSLWGMVGSANLTRPGLTTNHEACVIFDSREAGDTTPLKDIRTWLDKLFDQEYPEIDFDLARAVFETRNKQRATGAIAKAPGGAATRYWALKPGYCGEYWDNFLAENVVAIGWGEMTDPSLMTREQTAAAYREVWPEDSKGKVSFNVAQIIRFTQSMTARDLVLICGRYDSVGKEDKDAYIYGIARTKVVDGQCYFYDAESNWYRFKRHATIQCIKQFLLRTLVASALGVGAIVPTIQELDRDGFAGLVTLLRTELGIIVDV